MKIIYGPRGSGKTTQLIRKNAVIEKSIIVCPCKRNSDHIFKQAHEMGFNIPQPITFDEFVNNRFNSGVYKTVLIDNIDICLNTIIPDVEVYEVSATTNHAMNEV